MLRNTALRRLAPKARPVAWESHAITSDNLHEDGWFRFDVRIDLPRRVPLFHYLGWLEGSAATAKQMI